MQEIKVEGVYNITKPKTVFNVGAFDCADAIKFAELGCNVVAFEPMDIPHKPHNNMVLVQAAVSNLDGKITFHPSENGCSGSIHSPKNHFKIWPHVKFGEPIEVDCIKLDSFGASFDSVDLLYVDVNGGEKEFIEGATETLKKTEWLFIEVSNKELYTGQSTMDEILAMLPDWQLVGVYNDYERFCDILLRNGKRI